MKIHRSHILLICIATALSTASTFAESVHAKFGVVFRDTEFAEVLTRVVDAKGMVDYSALKAAPETFESYLVDIAGLYTDEYDGWPRERQLAFWINTYNALTLKVIIDHYPIASNWKAKLLYPIGIRHIPGAWDEKTFMVKGSFMTLDQIEHEVLRKQFSESRIHLALVCGAKGCPPLRGEPYDPERLDEQFEDQARTFVADPDKFKIDHDGRVIHLSSIFKWFGGDFVENYGEKETVAWGNREEKAVIAYLKPFLSDEDWSKLSAGSYKVSYLDYDWGLNEQDS